MSETMLATVLLAPHKIDVREVPKPTVSAPGDVVLKVEKTAICGTDLHPYEGRLPLEPDVVLGHEFLGTVVEVGSAVGQFTEGDRAVASCVVNCGFCRSCRRGDPARCANSRMFGMGAAFGAVDGGQAQYVLVPNADLTLRKLPESPKSSDDDLLFAGDILSTGYEAVRRAMRAGDVVAIVGAGPVGLCATMSAVTLGAERVIVVDRVPERLAQAEKLGALTVNFADVDPLEGVLALSEGRGADVVVDGVGQPAALTTACNIVGAGGTISIPGAYVEPEIALPFGQLWMRGVKIVNGVANIVNYMDEVMALTEAGKLSPAQIISHRLPMSKAAEAYEMFERREATKIVLDPWG